MDAREWFGLARTGLDQVVTGIGASQLADPGLGEWDVRSLLGHTSRAFATIENYLATSGPTAPTLHSPLDYYQAVSAGVVDPAQVAQRGRDAGAALGDDPCETAQHIAEQVTALVEATPDHAIVATPFGAMHLIDYLPTRAFEVTVHGIDLARAMGQPVPGPLTEVVPTTVVFACGLTGGEDQVPLLLALLGREPLPAGFSVLRV